MKLISHRRNTLQELASTPQKYGVEIDIRSFGAELILQHDPYVEGESLDSWIKFYKHGTLILNVKEEGLEERLIALMKAHNITDYFFLDQSFPYLMKFAKKGESRSAARFSEYESIETVLSLSGLVDWVWVDCFTHFPLTSEDAIKLKNAKFKLCLVSPELQGRNADIEIPQMIQILEDRSISVDAVCTKRPELWESNK
jgi:hypothetical protein